MRRNFGHDFFAAHMTGKTTETGIPLLSLNDAWISLSEKVRKLLRGPISLQVNACVLMSNHYHLLCSSQDRNLVEALTPFIGHAFDDDNFIRPIMHFNDYANTYKYIYRNPVEAGLVSQVETYEFSSLYGLLGKSSVLFPVIDNMNLIFNPTKILKWLNSSDASDIFGPVSLVKQNSHFKQGVRSES